MKKNIQDKRTKEVIAIFKKYKKENSPPIETGVISITEDDRKDIFKYKKEVIDYWIGFFKSDFYDSSLLFDELVEGLISRHIESKFYEEKLAEIKSKMNDFF